MEVGEFTVKTGEPVKNLEERFKCFHCNGGSFAKDSDGYFHKRYYHLGIDSCPNHQRLIYVRTANVTDLEKTTPIGSGIWWGILPQPYHPEVVFLVREDFIDVLTHGESAADLESFKLVRFTVPLWAVGESVIAFVPDDKIPIYSSNLSETTCFGLATFAHWDDTYMLWVDRSIAVVEKEYTIRVKEDILKPEFLGNQVLIPIQEDYA
jgi:hypothetical protein